MLERRHTVQRIGLELAALRIEHELQANLILRLTDLLFMSPGERDVMAALEVERGEVALWATGLRAPPTPQAGSSART